jgi:hypothetical protein
VSAIPDDVQQIRRDMALIRRDLQQSVQGVVETANAATDWRSYLVAHPWLFLGGAVATGYWLVPRRHPKPVTPADLSEVRDVLESTGESVVQAVRQTQNAADRRTKSLSGAALAILTPLAIRLAQGYALRYLEAWLAEHPRAFAPSDRSPRPAPADPAGRSSQGRGPSNRQQEMNG